MDIENLFNNQQQNQKTTAKRQKILSLINYLDTRPLFYGLEKQLVKHDFVLQQDVPSVSAARIFDGEVDAGIVPSVSYADSKGGWKIIPDIALVSKGPIHSVNLFFRKDLKDIRTVAIDTGARTSVALLKILFQEKYELIPEYKVMAPNLSEMLKIADAALIIGDKSLHLRKENPHCLDLGEEWFGLTGLPFVYAFWAGHELALSNQDIQILQESKQIGLQNLEQIAKQFASDHPHSSAFYFQHLSQHLSFDFGEEERAGLQEFYRYAFYFGINDYIPDLHFFEK